MLDILITTPKGAQTHHTLELGRHAIGRSSGSDIRISDRSMARKHAEIVLGPEEQCLQSVNLNAEVFKDDDRVTKYGPLRVGDVFTLGRCTLEVTASLIPECASQEPSEVQAAAQSLNSPPQTAQAPDMADPQRYAALTPVRKAIQQQVQTKLDLFKRNIISEMSAVELRAEAKRVANEVVASGAVSIPPDADHEALVEQVVAEAIGLGPIEPLLADDSITEVMVNGPEQVYIERAGLLQQVPVRFINDRSLMSAIERIVTPLGRRIDEGVPMVDARLADGSRVNAIIPPLSLTGPVVTIRKFAKKRFDMNRLIEIGSISPQMAEFLANCVEHRRNIVISGGTGSGKTTFLNALSDFIPDSERIVTIEDAAELRLSQQHVLSLEARPSNVEGKGQITIRDLVRNSLRMRPDRIVVGECRGGEALDMLQAMNTGHDGSLTTGHANSPRDLLSRLEVMVLMSGMELPVRAIREQISSAVNIIVQQSRFRDGKRRVTHIVEVDGMDNDTILLQNLFEFRQQGIDANGGVRGEYVGLGCAPGFYNELENAGVTLDRKAFDGAWSPEGGEPLTVARVGAA